MTDRRQKRMQLPWRLVVALGAVALLRPIIKLLGDVFGYTVSPAAVVGISALVALVWIGAVVKLKVRRPVAVLAASGVAYAVLSILMAVAVQAFVPALKDEEVKIPMLLTAGLLGSAVFNFAYGALLGVAAKFAQSRLK